MEDKLEKQYKDNMFLDRIKALVEKSIFVNEHEELDIKHMCNFIDEILKAIEIIYPKWYAEMLAKVKEEKGNVDN